MHKEDLLKYCRFYHGEKNNPYEGDKALLWDYERVWVEDSANDSDSISEYLSDYLTYGLRDFSKFDKIPVTLSDVIQSLCEKRILNERCRFRLQRVLSEILQVAKGAIMRPLSYFVMPVGCVNC